MSFDIDDRLTPKGKRKVDVYVGSLNSISCVRHALNLMEKLEAEGKDVRIHGAGGGGTIYYLEDAND